MYLLIFYNTPSIKSVDFYIGVKLGKYSFSSNIKKLIFFKYFYSDPLTTSYSNNHSYVHHC